ncbi:MAG: transglutaminase-like domain-containing protein [Candidatus Hodarchaeales archaeon]|jgi:hypothetical protein
MPIPIYSELNLFINEKGKVFSDKYHNEKIEPEKETEYWVRFRFFIKNRLYLIFKDLEKLKSKYLLKLHSGIWESESVFFLENPSNKSIANFSFEFLKPIRYEVQIPFRLQWNLKKNPPDTIVKIKLAQLGHTLQNIKINPNAKFIDKKPVKENLLFLLKLKSLPKNGNIDGSVSYSFTPSIEVNSGPWGSISLQDKSYVQKYTQKLPYWRESDESIYNLLKEPLESTSLLFISYYVYELAKKVITPSDQDLRKGVSTVLSEDKPAGDCDEFTDLIITIMRKLKIPIRRVNGISYPSEFHTWPEVYISDLKRWIPIDAALHTFGYLKPSIIPLLIDGTTSNHKLIEIETSNVLNTEFKLTIEDPEVQILGL